MSTTPHVHPLPADAERRVRGLLDGSLPPGERAAAMDHVRGCAPCREAYDRVADAEHALAGGDGVLGLPALERVAERLAEDARGVAPVRRVRPRWWLPAAAASAALAVVALRVGGLLGGTGEDFTPRGGGVSAAETVGIRLFRLGDAGAAELHDGDAVHRGDRIGASCTSGTFRAVRWSVRRADGGSDALRELDQPLTPRVVDEPIDASARVDGRFGAGDAVVTATFSGGGGPDARRSIRLRVLAEEAVP